MAAETSQLGRGHIEDDKDERDRTINLDALYSIANAIGPDKTSFSLLDDEFTNKTLNTKMKYERHIYSQGQLGSCTCNAVASAYRYLLQRQGKVNDQPIDFMPSRLFLYYVARIPSNTVLASGSQTAGNYYADLATTPPTTGALPFDYGSVIRDVIRIMARLGAPAESPKFVNWTSDTWPYIFIPFYTDQSEYDTLSDSDKQLLIELDRTAVNQVLPETALGARRPQDEAFRAAKQYTDLHYARPPESDYNSWKSCIANGYPIVFGCHEYPGFDDSIIYDKRIAATPTIASLGPQAGRWFQGHCMLAIGWDDEMDDWTGTGTKGCFKVQNSWGDKTGDGLEGGCCWVPFGWLTHQSPWAALGTTMINSPWVLVEGAAGTALCPAVAVGK
jgi:hypothetical protein